MNPGNQILNSSSSSSSSYIMAASSCLLFDGTKSKWTPEENKLFEDALALYDKETPDRWHNVARLVPGKSVTDVMNQYRKLEQDISYIEAGVILNDPVTLEWMDPQFYSHGGKRSMHDKKKGIPWTEEEHRQFLLGLKKYGKGDWRNISRNFVTSRTPTQVASHAQKYFIRQLSGGKDKRRSSIHDIHLNDHTTKKTQKPAGESSCTMATYHHHMSMSRPLYQWSHQVNQELAPNSSSVMMSGHGYGAQYGHLGRLV